MIGDRDADLLHLVGRNVARVIAAVAPGLEPVVDVTASGGGRALLFRQLSAQGDVDGGQFSQDGCPSLVQGEWVVHDV